MKILIGIVVTVGAGCLLGGFIGANDVQGTLINVVWISVAVGGLHIGGQLVGAGRSGSRRDP